MGEPWMIEATQKDIANIVDLVNIAYRAKDTQSGRQNLKSSKVIELMQHKYSNYWPITLKYF